MQSKLGSKGAGFGWNSLTPMHLTHTVLTKQTGEESFNLREIHFPHILPVPLLFLPIKGKLLHT